MDKFEPFDSLDGKAKALALHSLCGGCVQEAADLSRGKIDDPNTFLTAMAIIETLLMRLTGLTQEETVAVVQEAEANTDAGIALASLEKKLGTKLH